jgi:catechol 2,3-dioxygenase-like lactoylglutathione lyase family enzyme
MANTLQSIGDRVRRFSYVVVNVSDLERSKAFYESLSTLREVARYEVWGQSLAPLELASTTARFVAAVLDDQSGGDPVAVHLVQWLDPPPTGQAYLSFLDEGIVKLGICYPDPAAKAEQLRGAGVLPTNRVIVRDYYTVADPDGTLISFLHPPGETSERLYHACLAVISSVADTIRFYRDIIGLDHWMSSASPGPVPASQGPGSDVAHFESNFFRGRGDRRFQIDCSKSHLAVPCEPRHRLANHLGISRFALEVDNIDACAETLLEACAGADFGLVHGVPVRWDLGAAGARRVLLVRDPSQHVFELFEPERPSFVDLSPKAPAHV